MPFVDDITPVDAHVHASGGAIRRLLVVDQQHSFVGLARLVARSMGYQTDAVHDPRDLATRFREWRPDVVIIEIVLPEMDGIEMIGVLSELGFDGQLILVTGHEPKYLELARKTAEAKSLQVATSLTKPARTAQMIQALAQCELAATMSAALE